MSKTNIELVKFVKDKVGLPYMYGTTGQVITAALIAAKTITYPNIYDDEYVAKCRKNIGRIGYDCAGLIDDFLDKDMTADGYFAAATQKDDTISTMPNIAGVLVHKPGHIGIYIGGGYVVEARGIDYGVVKTKLADRGWKKWSKCPYIQYLDGRPTNPYSIPVMTLYKGNVDMTDKEVKWLQFELNWRYGNVVEVDGKFGPITEKYLGIFQKEAGLAVDFRCGPLTKAKLIK